MKSYLFVLLSVLFIYSCKTDEQKQNDFAGTYEVTVEVENADDSMEEARENMKKDIDEAKEEIREEMKKAREEIKEEFGEDSNLGDAIGQFVEGMGHFAEGMTELGESLGELGIDIGAGILHDLRFNATFEADGDVELGRRRGIRISTGDELRWKIENGKFVLYEEDGETNIFEIHEISDTEFDLVGEDVTFHLIRDDKNNEK